MSESQTGFNNFAIIVAVHNRMDVTSLCLDSVFTAKTDSKFHVFIVNDGSKPSETERLEYLVKAHKQDGGQITYFHNMKATGFSAANNTALRMIFQQSSAYTHICLLNSDTVVTDRWLDRLALGADSHLVGPVTNSSGNEQIIQIDYEVHGANGYAKAPIQNFANSRYAQFQGSFQDTEMLGFFCVAGATALFQRIGLLDEQFGAGYFEDNDYCLRAQLARIPMKINRAVYIHHWGSSSFKILGEKKIAHLFKRNKRLFINKHGCEPHDYKWALEKSLVHDMIHLKKNQAGNQELVKMLGNSLFAQRQTIHQAYSQHTGFIPDGGLFHHIRTIMKQKMLLKSRRWHKRVALKLCYYIFSSLFRTPREVQKITTWLPRRGYEIVCSALQETAFFLEFILFRRQDSATTLIFPIQSFFGRMQRPQHLAINIASSRRKVLWIDAIQSDSRKKTKGLKRINSNLYVLSVHLPNVREFYSTSLPTIEAKHLWETIHRKLFPFKQPHSYRKISLILQSPYWTNIGALHKGEFVYDCMDFHEGFESATSEVIHLENDLLNNAKDVICSSTYLEELVQKKNISANTHLIRNGCNPGDFRIALPTEYKDRKEKTVGYFGAIAEWFDAELVCQLAEIMPNTRFELVGNTAHSGFSSRKNLPDNIFLLGEQPYSHLAPIAAHWAAALIPFHISELILATNPVKLYEYSALRLPVISTPIPEVINSGADVYIGKTAEDFARLIEVAISSDNDTKRTARQDFARKNSWKQRAQNLTAILDNLYFSKNLGIKRKTYRSTQSNVSAPGLGT